MDREEEKVLYLSRVGRDKIFKYGTYTMATERPITQDHPFYVPREQTRPIHPFDEPVQQNAAVDSAASPEPAQMPDPGPEPDPEVLASQIMSSNFKVGLSQEEVDALLNGM
ncbi:MAG: hypothetical protein J5574_04175 [Lachnospiraceae bacterium]|nr:hypothetical protein [Lachnospiraceae bacterium]